MPELSTTNLGATRLRTVFGIGCLLFISFTSLYLFFPPDLASQPWDSLQYANSMETEGLRSIRGNHPLGHVILGTVFSLAKHLGYEGRALSISQVTNGVLGGLIIAIFFILLVTIIKIRALHAAGFSLIVGASYAFLFFTGTSDIYHFSILLSLLAWVSLTYELTLRDRPVLFISGILTGLSILSHQLNLALIPAGLAFFFLAPGTENPSKTEKFKHVAVFLLTSSAVAVLGYLLLGFIATASLSIARVIGWMRGYFGDPTYGRYLNTRVFETAWTTVSQEVMFSPQNKAEYLGHGFLAMLVLLMFLGLWFSKALSERKRSIMIASALQCLITWPLILWWEPQNPKFWLLTLIPWLIVLALSFEAMETSLRNWLPEFGNSFSRVLIVLPLIMGIVILSINIQHTSDKEDAVAFNEALDVWMNNSSPNDVLITSGDLIPHLKYWGKRPNTINLYRSLQASQTSTDGFYDLREEINQALCAHRTVLIAPAASEYVPDSQLSLVGVTREELRSYLYENAHRGEILFWYRNGWDGKLLPVYAIRQALACVDPRAR